MPKISNSKLRCLGCSAMSVRFKTLIYDVSDDVQSIAEVPGRHYLKRARAGSHHV